MCLSISFCTALSLSLSLSLCLSLYVHCVCLYIKPSKLCSIQKKTKYKTETENLFQLEKPKQPQAEHEFSNKSSLIRRGGICIFVDEDEAEAVTSAEQKPRGITFAAAATSPLPKCPLCGLEITTTATTTTTTATTNTTTTNNNTTTTTTTTTISDTTNTTSVCHATQAAVGDSTPTPTRSRFWHKRLAAVAAFWQQSKNRKQRFKTGCSHCGATGELFCHLHEQQKKHTAHFQSYPRNPKPLSF